MTSVSIFTNIAAILKAIVQYLTIDRINIQGLITLQNGWNHSIQILRLHYEYIECKLE